MAKGEKKFDGSKRKVSRFNNKPAPIADYDFKLESSKAEVKKAKTSNMLYVQAKIELLDSADKEGGKNKKYPLRLYLQTTPGADGIANVDRGDGIVALGKAIGKPAKNIDIVKAVRHDLKGKVVVKTKVEALDAMQVKQWLAKVDGATGRLHTGIDTDDKEQEWGRIDYYIEPGEVDDEEEDIDEDEETDESEDETDEDEETEEDEDESEDEDEDSDEDSNEDEEDSDDEDEDEDSDDEEEPDEDEEADDEDEDEAPKKGKKAVKKPAKKGKK